MTEPDFLVPVTPARLVEVIEQMATLPWPDGDEWIPWEIDGCEGESGPLRPRPRDRRDRRPRAAA